MKKNFFKKLSFVLALAMLITSISPAAGAFAATAFKLNATSKVLYLGVDGKDKYNFNITAGKKTGYKYAWSSANKKVATVNASNGIATAVAPGSTKITLKVTDSKKKAVGSISATVTVRDNIKTVAISNLPEKAIAVNAEYDFNRSYTTVSGLKSGSKSITRWEVSDTTNASIVDSTGVFKATKGGKYTITARAFETTANYNTWKTSKAASLVLAEVSAEITVAPSVVSTKQINTTKFAVTFDSDMTASDIKTASAVYQVINGKEVSTGTEKIKSVSLDTTGTVATVEMYTAFNTKTAYNYKFGDLVGTFTSADTSASQIAGIVFDDFNVNMTTGAGEDMKNHVSAVNADGVVILTGANAYVAPYLTFTYGGDNNKGFTGGSMAYIYTEGYSATITAKFESYVYDEVTKQYNVKTFTDAAVATGVKTSVDNSTLQFAIATARPADDKSAWTDGKSLAAKDESYQVFARYKNTTDGANDAWSKAGDPAKADFIYESSNTDILLITGKYFYPVSAGTVTVIVKTNDANVADRKVVSTFDLTIKPARTMGTAAIDNNAVEIGNNTNVNIGEVAKAVITVADSLGNAFVPIVTSEFINKPTSSAIVPNINIVPVTSGDDVGKVNITVDAHTAGTPTGVYNVKFTVKYPRDNTSRDIYFRINVKDGAVDLVVSSWQLVLSDQTVDLKNNSGKNIDINVFGFNKYGSRVAKLAPSEYDVVLKKGDTPVYLGSNTQIPVVSVSGGAATGALVAYEANKAYLVTASVTGAGVTTTGKVAGFIIGALPFTVTDTTSLTVGLKNGTVDAGSILKIVQDGFKFQLNGADIDDTKITSIVYTTGSSLVTASGAALSSGLSGSDVRIVSVEYTKTYDNGNSMTYKYDVNTTIKVR